MQAPAAIHGDLKQEATMFSTFMSILNPTTHPALPIIQH